MAGQVISSQQCDGFDPTIHVFYEKQKTEAANTVTHHY
jgi:hypothetical protein